MAEKQGSFNLKKPKNIRAVKTNGLVTKVMPSPQRGNEHGKQA